MPQRDAGPGLNQPNGKAADVSPRQPRADQRFPPSLRDVYRRGRECQGIVVASCPAMRIGERGYRSLNEPEAGL